MKRIAFAALLVPLVVAAPLVTLHAQDTTGRGRGATGRRGGGGGRAWTGPMDSARARELYVSRDPADLRGCMPAECQRQIERKRVNDSIYVAHAPGNYEFQ